MNLNNSGISITTGIGIATGIDIGAFLDGKLPGNLPGAL